MKMINLDQFSAKQRRIIETAIETAMQTETKFQHGAVLACRTKILCTGTPKFREYLNRQVVTSLHAELCVMHYLTKLGTRTKADLWIIRLGTHDNQIVFRNSTPCTHCCQKLIKHRIRRVWYSTDSGQIVCQKPSEIKSRYTHYGQIQYVN